MLTTPVLEARNVSHRFGGVWANRDVSLTLDHGEIRGLIGPNGAGKTTFLNLLTGIYAPVSGSVWLETMDITGKTPSQIARRGLVRTFQTPKLFPSMTVLENLSVPTLAAHPWRPRGAASSDGQRAEELLELTRLEGHRDERAQNLSGGQQMLLQIAVGLMVPGLKCYVMDEPFAGINPVLKDRVFEVITHQNRHRDIAFLIVSHEMAEIRRLCSRVSVLVEGHVFREGTMDEIVEDPGVVEAYLQGQGQMRD
jgi:branched-chain amino acid transport system ATP-binding protein